MVVRAADGRARTARSQRAEARLRALRQGGAAGRIRQRRSISIFTPAGLRCASSATRPRPPSGSPAPPRRPRRRLSIARAAYWRGRAAEAMGEAEEAKLDYESAASEPIAYYGQLAADASRGEAARAARAESPSPRARDARRGGAGGGGALCRDGLDELATALAFEAARNGATKRRWPRWATVVKRYGRRGDASAVRQDRDDARLRLRRDGVPSTGVPAFLPLAHSADLASVYAVARQESEFLWRAASGAGAKGLMQILPSTAASTARRAGCPIRSGPAHRRSGLQHPARRGLPRPGDGGRRRLARNGFRRLQRRARAGWRSGSRPTAIRARARPISSTGSSAFPSTRRATTCSGSAENLGVYRQRFADEPPARPPVPVFAARESRANTDAQNRATRIRPA